jgi:tRNA pseudouridine55 synthase
MKPLLSTSKVGHTGTLDPFAQGVLLICFGRATKLFPYLQGEKEYRALLRLGQKMDTGDLTGRIIEEVSVGDLEREKVEWAISGFVGEIWQRPPRFSALKQGGKRLYDLARRGVKVEPTPRRIRIRRISLKKFTLPFLELEVVCSSGTYIRSLAYDIGDRLGCGAHLVKLVRTRIGGFRVEDSVPPEEVRELAGRERWGDFVIPMQRALSGFKEVRIFSSSKPRVVAGLPLRGKDISSSTQGIRKGDRIKVLDQGGNLLALLLAEADMNGKAKFEASYLRVLC